MANVKFPDYYTFNSKFKPGIEFWVVLNQETFKSTYTRFFKQSNTRTKYIDKEKTFTIVRLKDKKRIWNKENIQTTIYKKIIVGKKKKTTHLPEGIIYQLELLKWIK